MKKIAMIVTFLLTFSVSTSVFANTYTVKRGDSLWGISSKNHVSVSTIKKLNGLKGNTIFVGQKLVLSKTTTSTSTGKSTISATTTTTHTVVPGETLWSVSSKYKMSVSQLMSINHLKSNTIFVGQKLVVNQVSQTQPTPTTPKKYTVVHGDTLSKIADQFKVTVKQIQTWNKLTSNYLHTGQVLVVSAGSTPSDGGTTPAPPPVATKTVVITGDYVNFRTGPNTTYSIITTLPMNSSGTFISQTGTWIKATFNGKTGYLSQGYAKIVDSGTTPTTPSNPNGKVVVLDPGHGGADPGAPGIDRVTYEHQINYAVAVKTKAELEKRGYKVIMTRGNNQSCVPHYELHSDLQCRVDVATNNHANIFVSIHANWSQYPNAYGIEGYYNAKSTSDYPQMNPYPAQSQKLANLVEAQVVSAMNGYNRGVQNASLYVNRMAKVPSTLVELGFLSNPSDLAKMKDPSRQQRIASGIATAIDSYFSN